MKFYWVLPALLISSFTFAFEKDIEKKYIKNYIASMKQPMIENFKENLPNSSNREIKKLADSLVPKMAKCQFESIKHYPKDYRDRLVIPVSEGADVLATSDAFDEHLVNEIANGLISEQELIELVTKTEEKLRSCMDN